MTRCSASLVIRQMQMKALMRYHYMPISMPYHPLSPRKKNGKKEKRKRLTTPSLGENVEQLEQSDTASLSVKWRS